MGRIGASQVCVMASITPFPDDSQVAASTSLLPDERRLLDAAISGNGLLLFGQDGRELPGAGDDPIEQLVRLRAGEPVVLVAARDDGAIAVRPIELGPIEHLEPCPDERDVRAAIARATSRLAPGHARADARTAAIEQLQRLSRREVQVLCGMLAGMTNKQIARRLQISPRTVEMHRASMMADLGVRSSAEAIRIGLDADLPPLGQEVREAKIPEPRPRGRPSDLPDADRAGLPAVTELLDGASDCVLIFDPGFNLIYLNRSARMVGAQDAARPGGHLWDAFPWCGEDFVRQRLEQAQAERGPIRFEHHAEALGRWFDVNIQPVPNGLLLWFRDRTSDRARDLAIRQNEERLRFALEAAGDGAWDWNVAQGLVHLSRRFLERLGGAGAYSAAGAADLWRLVHPDDRRHLKATLKAQLAGTSESFLCEYRLRTRQGGWRWNLDRGRVVARDPVSGDAVRIVASSTDVTVIRRAQHQLFEAHDRLCAALEASGAGWWDVDTDLAGFRVCPRSRDLLGLPADGPSELTLRDWRERLHRLDAAATLKAFALAAGAGEPFSARFRVIGSDGTIRWRLLAGRVGAAGGAEKRLSGLIVALEDEAGARRRAPLPDKLDRLTDLAAIASTLADELSGMTRRPRAPADAAPKARAGRPASRRS